MKYVYMLLCFSLIPLMAQDITYTNENIQVVDQIVPDEGIVENTEPFSLHGNWSSQYVHQLDHFRTRTIDVYIYILVLLPKRNKYSKTHFQRYKLN